MSKLTKSLNIFSVIILTGLAITFGFAGCDSDGNMANLFDFEPSPDDTNELKPLIVGVVEEPQPFRANDGLVHLVYEVQIENFTTETIDLKKLSVFGVRGEQAPVPLLVLEGGNFMIRTLLLQYHPFKKAPLDEVTVDQLGPGQTGVTFLDVTLDNFENVPDRLINVVEIDGPPIIAQLLGESALSVSTKVDVNLDEALVLGQPKAL